MTNLIAEGAKNSFLTVEREAVEGVRLGGWNVVLYQVFGLALSGSRVVRQTLQRDLLFGHQFTGTLVHLRIVDPQAAEYRKRLENRYVTVRELQLIVLRERVIENSHRYLFRLRIIPLTLSIN